MKKSEFAFAATGSGRSTEYHLHLGRVKKSAA